MSGQFDLVGSGASIGSVVTGGTQGSVLFVGAGSVLAQDNTHFFWDDTANSLSLLEDSAYNGGVLGGAGNFQSTNNTAVLAIGGTYGLNVAATRTDGIGIRVESSGGVGSSSFLGITDPSRINILTNGGFNRFTDSTTAGYVDISPDANGIISFSATGSTPKFNFLNNLQVTLTTEQTRIGYDTSNYFTTTVGSTGIATFDAVGSGSAFVFSDPVTVSSLTNSALTSGRVTFAAGGGALTDSANMTFSSATLTLGVANTAAGNLKLFMSSGIQSITFAPPGSIASSYTITLPTSATSAGVWVNSGGGSTTFQSPLALNLGGTNATSFGASRVLFMNSGNTAFSSDSAFTFATPKLTLVAATTAGASLTIPAGTAPTSPVAGDLWTDTTQKTFTAFQSGIKQTLAGTIFTQTADKTVTNTTTETTIVGTGTGTLSLPANFFVIGKTVSVRMSGVYSTVAVTGDTVTIKVKYGTTVLASKATSALVTGGTNLYWESNVLVTCRTTGATGTVQVSGGVVYQIAGSAIVEDELNNGVATTTLDTTASGLFDVTVTHGTADASNTVKSLVGAFQVLN